MPQTHKLVGRRYSDKRVQSPDSLEEQMDTKVADDAPVRKRGRPRLTANDDSVEAPDVKTDADDDESKQKGKMAARKRKALEDEKGEAKVSKVVSEVDSPASRRSSRKVVPNRKYADMVTDIFDASLKKTTGSAKAKAKNFFDSDSDDDDEDEEIEDFGKKGDGMDESSPKPSTSSSKGASTKTPAQKTPASKTGKVKLPAGKSTPGVIKTPMSTSGAKMISTSKPTPGRPPGRPPLNPKPTPTKPIGGTPTDIKPKVPTAANKSSFLVSKSPGSAPTTVKRTPIAIQSTEMQAAVKEAVRLGKSTATVRRSSLPAGTSIKTTVVTIEKSADNKPRKRIRVITVYPEDSSSESEAEVDDEASLLPPPDAPPPSPLLTLDSPDDGEKLDPFYGDLFTGIRPSLSEPRELTPPDIDTGMGEGLAPLGGNGFVSMTEGLNGDVEDRKGKIRVELITFTDERFVEFDPARRVELNQHQINRVHAGLPIYLKQEDAGINDEPLVFLDADSSSVSTQTLFNGGHDDPSALPQVAIKPTKPRKPRAPNTTRINTSNILRDLMTTAIAPTPQNLDIMPTVEAKTHGGSSKALRYVTVVPGPESVANMAPGATPQTQYVIVEFDEDMTNMPQDKIASLISSVTQGQVQQAPTVVDVGVGQPQQPDQPELVIAEEKPGASSEYISVDFKSTFDDASGTFLYRCTKCYYSTLCKANIVKHRRKHSYLKPFQCKLCAYRCTTSSNLKRHQAIHTNERAHTCSICGYKFRQKIHVIRHIKYRHQEKTVCCPLCDYVCANENPDLKMHMKRRHSLPVDDGTIYKCPFCDEVSANIRDLQQHLKLHKSGPEIKIRCDKCSFVTDCNSRYKRHMLVHTREKPYACSLCAYRASQKEHVVRHMRTKHSTGNLPIPVRKSSTKARCVSRDGREATKITQKIVNSIGSLDFSTQEKIFGCNHCTMKFAKLINLYKHLYSQHSHLMPDQNTNFNCVVCEFHTNNKKNLLTHMRKHNQPDESVATHVYTCVLCTYVSRRRRNLLQHMKKKHSIQITTAENGATIMSLPESAAESLPPRTMELAPPQRIESAMTATSGGFVNIAQGSQIIQSNVAAKKPISSSQYQQTVIGQNPTVNMPLTESVPISHLLPNQQMSLLQGGNVMNQLQQQLRMTSGPIQVLVENPDKKMISVELGDIPTSMETGIADPAVEAIAGLQALSAQNVDLSNTEIMINNGDFVQEMAVKSEEPVMQEIEPPVAPADEQRSFQLTDEQLMNLSSGDFIEINGEIYKVEFSS